MFLTDCNGFGGEGDNEGKPLRNMSGVTLEFGMRIGANRRAFKRFSPSRNYNEVFDLNGRLHSLVEG